MRTAFIKALIAEAKLDPTLWLLNGDLGYSVLEPFAAEFPERYVNVGVAEQNMVGIAAGLALSGKNVFTYSIANFATLRCIEQIRNDVCYHSANVTIVGVGGGLSYGSQGYTHHAVEDTSGMRMFPKMTVLCPGDPVEADWATRALARNKGPGYLRLGKAGEPAVHKAPLEDFPIGKALRLKEGDAVSLISTGNMLETAAQTAALLEERGIAASVVSMPTVKPLDVEFIVSEARRVPLLCVLEEHVRDCGLAESIALRLLEADGTRAKILPVHVGDTISSGLVGSQQDLRRVFGMDPAAVAERIAKRLSELST